MPDLEADDLGAASVFRLPTPNATEALEAFWRKLAEFVDVMTGWSEDVRPPVEFGTPGLTVVNPIGYAEVVGFLRDRVDRRKLSISQAALFDQAAETFGLLCVDCGCAPGSDDYGPLRKPSRDNLYLMALARLVARRRPSAAAGERFDAPPPDVVSIECSKAELLAAYGKSGRHSKFIEGLVRNGIIKIGPAESPIGHAKYHVEFKDPQAGGRIIAKILKAREDDAAR